MNIGRMSTDELQRETADPAAFAEAITPTILRLRMAP
jgi:hypothetical protein